MFELLTSSTFYDKTISFFQKETVQHYSEQQIGISKMI